MKPIQTLINLILAGGIILALLAVGRPGSGGEALAAPPAVPLAATSPGQPGCDPGRSVQVSGAAVVNVTPDRALIQLGVQSNGVTPQTVEAANTAAIARVAAAIQALGVQPKDIATDWYIIEPVYEDYDSLSIKGYRINNMLAVTLRDVSQTSTVIAAALQAGANQVINVDLYTSELRKHRDQARQLAIQAASEKAAALARAAGAETGCVLTINENSWSYYNGWWYGRDRNQWTQNVVQNAAPAGNGGAAGSADAESVSLGQISVKAEVSVSYGLR